MRRFYVHKLSLRKRRISLCNVCSGAYGFGTELFEYRKEYISLFFFPGHFTSLAEVTGCQTPGNHFYLSIAAMKISLELTGFGKCNNAYFLTVFVVRNLGLVGTSCFKYLISEVNNHLNIPRTVPVLSWKVLCPIKSWANCDMLSPFKPSVI